jgi:starch phosphorylase
MTLIAPMAGKLQGYIYNAAVRSERPASHFTPRIVPFYPAAQIPLEESLILWFR